MPSFCGVGGGGEAKEEVAQLLSVFRFTSLGSVTVAVLHVVRFPVKAYFIYQPRPPISKLNQLSLSYICQYESLRFGGSRFQFNDNGYKISNTHSLTNLIFGRAVPNVGITHLNVHLHVYAYINRRAIQ